MYNMLSYSTTKTQPFEWIALNINQSHEWSSSSVYETKENGLTLNLEGLPTNHVVSHQLKKMPGNVKGATEVDQTESYQQIVIGYGMT